MSKLIVKVQYRIARIEGMTEDVDEPLVTEIYCAESFSRYDRFKQHPRAEFVSIEGDVTYTHHYHVNGKGLTGEEPEDERPASRIWVETLTGTRIETLQPQPETPTSKG